MRTLLLVVVLLSCVSAADGLVVHEWGTFTSLLDNDGRTLVWTAPPTPLPWFVQRAPLGKTLPTLQRIETPVIYLHSDHAQDVMVEVDIPAGRHTEWYPPAAVTPDARRLSWRVRAVPGGTAPLPGDAEAGAYARARDADAALLESLDMPDQRERFLFYRGMASFPAPLRATATASGWALANTGSDAIGPLLVIETAAGRTRWSESPPLAAGTAITVTRPESDAPAAAAWGAIGGRLRLHLTAAGLNPDEAAAMVSTWHEWGDEDGVRVLYLLPRAFADRALPLRVIPQPVAVERVLVGRAELASATRISGLRAAVLGNDWSFLARDRFAAPILASLTGLPAGEAALVKTWLAQPR